MYYTHCTPKKAAHQVPFNQVFEQVFGLNHAQNKALVNLKNTPTNFVIELAAPGLKKEDFKIEVEKNTLTISADKKTENAESYQRKEFDYQQFSRSFSLPEIADQDNINAKYEDGILSIVIEKKEVVKPESRSINIS